MPKNVWLLTSIHIEEVSPNNTKLAQLLGCDRMLSAFFRKSRFVKFYAFDFECHSANNMASMKV